MDLEIIDIKTVSTDKQGSLSFFEGDKDLPFEIKRFYYIYGAPEGVKRGGHAHKNLTQILFCPYGKIEIILDTGYEKASVCLDDPKKGLIVRSGMWRDMIWHKDDSVLCVAADSYYNAEDYIRDYGEFLKYYKIKK